MLGHKKLQQNKMIYFLKSAVFLCRTFFHENQTRFCFPSCPHKNPPSLILFSQDYKTFLRVSLAKVPTHFFQKLARVFVSCLMFNVVLIATIRWS